VSESIAMERGRATGRGVAASFREQAVVAGGQIAAGIGNLAFAFAAARILDPAQFALVAAFLALYLVIHVPTRGLEAVGALAPEDVARHRPRAAGYGLLASALLVGVALPFRDALGLTDALVVALALAPPLACLLALERGRLYGVAANGSVVATLVAEPIVRLALGIPLAVAAGAGGAAAAILIAGAVAWVVALLGGRGEAADTQSAGKGPAQRMGAVAVLSFLALAVVQSQDLIFANATLGGADAGLFAALSTLGGIAAFATSTIPFVLIPRVRDGSPGALSAAVLAAIALSGAAAGAVMLAPGPIVETLFGDSYAAIAPLAAPYLLAMGLLGVGRVLVANALALGRGRMQLAIVAIAAVAQLGALFALGDDPAAIARITLIAAAGTLISLLVLEALQAPRPAIADAAQAATPPSPSPSHHTRLRDRIDWRAVAIVAGLIAVGVGIRVVADRSLWLDEATSWYQSQLPFPALIEDLRTTDVHPPLYGILLWLTVHVTGESELGLRALSIAAGAGLIAMLFVTGRAMFDRRTGLIAATLGTLAPILIWYSGEARMYSLLALLGLIAVWAQYQAVSVGKLRYWLIYAIAAAAVVWTHYFGALLVAVLQLAILVDAVKRRGTQEGRRSLLGFLFTGGAILALLAPLVGFALDQFSANEAAGKGFDNPQQAGGALEGREVSLYAGMTNGIWAIWGYHSADTMEALTALWPFLMLGVLMMLGRGRSRATATLVAAAALPLLPLLVAAFKQPFLFELRFNMTAVPLMLLLGARAIAAWSPGPAWRWGLGLLAAATLVGGTIDQQVNGTNPRLYDFEGALSDVSDAAGPNSRLLYSPDFLNNVIDYYAPGVEAERLPELQGLEEATSGEPGEPDPRKVFVLGSFSDNPNAEAAIDAAVGELRSERELVEVRRYPQVKVWTFR
jgi:O-antigen/teichoic acid export membrane protein